MKINIKHQLVGITVAIGIVSAIIVVIIIIPSIKKILSLESDITATQTQLEEQYEKTKRLRNSISSLQKVTEQVEKFKKSIVQEGDELQIITELERIASSNNIEQNLRVQKTEAGTAKKGSDETQSLPATLRNKAYYSFSFVNSGDFKNHVNYFKEIEDLPYYFIITSINFDKKIEKNEKGKVDARFNAQLYITDK